MAHPESSTPAGLPLAASAFRAAPPSATLDARVAGGPRELALVVIAPAGGAQVPRRAGMPLAVGRPAHPMPRAAATVTTCAASGAVTPRVTSDAAHVERGVSLPAAVASARVAVVLAVDAAPGGRADGAGLDVLGAMASDAVPIGYQVRDVLDDDGARGERRLRQPPLTGGRTAKSRTEREESGAPRLASSRAIVPAPDSVAVSRRPSAPSAPLRWGLA